MDIALARQQFEAAQASHQRRVLLFTGDADWTAAAACQTVAALPELTPVWLTERPLADQTLPIRNAIQLLGQDLELLIYDAHSGFDPDGFGAATGAIRGGGLLLLLTPPLDEWPLLTDPQAVRIAVWPHSAASLSGRFLARLVDVLKSDPMLVTIQQSTSDPVMADRQRLTRDYFTSESDGAEPLTPDQQQAVAAIIKTAQGRARRPLVLTAHRGRGKSAALGLAAGHLLKTGHCRVLVTAPTRAAVAALFRHANAMLREADGTALTDSLRFYSPAALVAETPAAELLLVDEAAGIPAPLLAALLEHYPRIIFATTVHGYEGTGRGFEIRFRATLNQLTPDWRALRLESPIRWAADDPLEALCFRALLLDAAPAPDQELMAATSDTCHCERLNRNRLAQDDSTLRELFGLLVLAHYQTRPMDLRMLLDGSNLRIYVLRYGGRIAATLLAAAEGDLDAALHDAIYLGQRRPRGHLLPQTLSAHAGLYDAPAWRYLRVVRIAVHPALSRRGLGRRLLRQLAHDARAEGIDLLGASFGATPALLHFWERCGYRAAQIGTSRNAASGEHAVVVLRRLNARSWQFAIAAAEHLALLINMENFPGIRGNQH